MHKVILPVAGLLVIVIAAIAIYANRDTETVTDDLLPTDSATIQATADVSPTVSPVYNDGTYRATGTYVTPGGLREVAITLTLEDAIVTTTEFQGGDNDATTKRFQSDFATNYVSQVVGKNIDTLNLQKVSGSSLTSKGFNEAVAKIKVQAQS